MAKQTKKKIISLGQSVDGKDLTLEIDIVTGSNGELLISNHKVISKTEEEIEAEHNAAITKMLDSIDFNEAISKDVIESHPAEEIRIEDFVNLPSEIIANEFELKKVVYAKPVIGKVAKDVELHFTHENKLFITAFDVEFKYTFEEFQIEEISENDIEIDESILTLSPNVLQSGDVSYFKVKSPFDKVVSIRSYVTAEDHNTTTPVVNITVQVKNPMGNNPEYFTKTIVYKSKPFEHSDVDFVFLQVDQIERLVAQTTAPAEFINDFQIDYSPIIDEGCEVEGIRPTATYDKDSNEIIVTLVIKAYGITKEANFIVVFERTFNENLIRNIASEDINLDALRNIISTDNPSFNDDIFTNKLINKSGIESNIEYESLTTDEDKRIFEINIVVRAGQWRSVIRTKAKLGIGSFPLNSNGIIKNNGVKGLPKKIVNSINSYNFDDINVKQIAKKQSILTGSSEAINKTRVINIA